MIARAVIPVVALVAVSVTPAGAGPGATAGQGDYRAPVSPVSVVRPFEAPQTRFGPGHRGVDLAVGRGGAVRAAGAGVVAFAGQVAGRGVVVVLHPNGLRTEYEPVSATVGAGAHVGAGQLLGRVSGRHPGCAADRCLHWGARRGETYVDPLSLLRRLGPVRLLPWDGPP